MFRKKHKCDNQIIDQIKNAPCNHVWKDFNWFYTKDYKENYRYPWILTLWEPYVCIKCKERKNVELISINTSSYKDLINELNARKQRYKQLKEQEEVEDEVNDFIYLDPVSLKLFENIKAQTANKTEEFVLKLIDSTKK